MVIANFLFILNLTHLAGRLWTFFQINPNRIIKNYRKLSAQFLQSKFFILEPLQLSRNQWIPAKAFRIWLGRVRFLNYLLLFDYFLFQ